MNRIPEYNINGTMIIGVDAGYGNYKTAHTSFPTGIIKSDKAPIFTCEFIKYDGCYYTLGENHKNFVAQKETDEDNYVLTLAAIAKELKERGYTKARIHLAVGLPLKWVQSQRENFRNYMMQNSHVDLEYKEQKYSIDIVDCTVVPQCYAAIAEKLYEFKGMYMIADIGNGTMNLMIMNNGKVTENKSWTVKLGIHQCFMGIQNRVMDRTGEKLPDEIIENYLRTGETDVDEKYAGPMKEAAGLYVDQLMAFMKDHDYNPLLMKLYILGGGARIFEAIKGNTLSGVTYNNDIRANAKGYEYFCYMKLRKHGGR